ncbi:hypothetical protein GCM10028804_59640 [Larkinella terrae]
MKQQFTITIPALNLARLFTLAGKYEPVATPVGGTNMGTVQVALNCTPQELFDLGGNMMKPSPYQ